MKKEELAARLSELREKLEAFPYTKSRLMKQYNAELSYGSVSGAESVRVKIQDLEGEAEALRLEVKSLEALDQEQS